MAGTFRSPALLAILSKTFPLERLYVGRHMSSTAAGVFDVLNPATGKLITSLPEDSQDQVAQKFAQAQAGQREWKKGPLQERQEALRTFNKLLLSRTDSLAATLTSEMGKPLSQARNEIRATPLRIQYLIDNAPQVLERQDVFGSAGAKVRECLTYEPLGVVANISAWNYPYFTSANVFAAALVTGNSVLYKPSEHTTLTGLAIGELLHEAGVPEDAFVTVTGRGSTGAAVASLPGLGGVFFTGSNPTGAKIAAAAAPNMVKVQLELGGKDPVYVRPDVDVRKAAEAIADGAFYNNGQSCCSVERIYVHASIHDEFVDAFAATVEAFKMDDPTADGTYLGPVTRQPHVAFLKAQVEDALTKGATPVVLGSHTDFTSRRGYFFPPVVLKNVDHTMSLMREETFGPVIGIQSVSGDDEAVSLMNDTKYGLTAGVYTKDGDAAERILAELNVGSGYWNCCDRVSPRLPWSGRKSSGVGSTLGLDGLRSFVRPKALHLQAA
ncbi:Aldehyde dehydrogenase [Klebsormidium nitens]|uniref:Aldehyde dehydrogenase n=1 Tax=Klebsormidium nitens TaxID=105231 RepID=A0A1Y1HJV0_KLENI|nr:Aldehyde dehydrogenase [Klebsormidium nitens]|eukprot:GAQ77842.1 Aldehyde dehydrogenase [Klebsormidium nitens]